MTDLTEASGSKWQNTLTNHCSGYLSLQTGKMTRQRGDLRWLITNSKLLKVDSECVQFFCMSVWTSMIDAGCKVYMLLIFISPNIFRVLKHLFTWKWEFPHVVTNQFKHHKSGSYSLCTIFHNNLKPGDSSEWGTAWLFSDKLDICLCCYSFESDFSSDSVVPNYNTCMNGLFWIGRLLVNNLHFNLFITEC